MTPRLHPIELTAVWAIGLGRVARAVLVPCVALVLTVAGWQPARTTPAAQPAPAPVDPSALVAVTYPTVVDHWAARLTVVELRQMARAAGHRALARSGRRAELLAVLA
jgi:hypothetical protein